jgi:hypothetical protein
LLTKNGTETLYLLVNNICSNKMSVFVLIFISMTQMT